MDSHEASECYGNVATYYFKYYPLTILKKRAWEYFFDPLSS